MKRITEGIPFSQVIHLKQKAVKSLSCDLLLPMGGHSLLPAQIASSRSSLTCPYSIKNIQVELIHGSCPQKGTYTCLIHHLHLEYNLSINTAECENDPKNLVISASPFFLRSYCYIPLQFSRNGLNQKSV